LDVAAFSGARADGAAMNSGEVVEYALSDEAHAPPASTTASGRSPIGARPVTLTRREEEVATLVARGLTNRQIASELSISEHTVANHVARAMRKLGLSSRSQLAAWVAERQQPPSSN
jgi:DNA-binding NarL/FixJ family response regulator